MKSLAFSVLPLLRKQAERKCCSDCATINTLTLEQGVSIYVHVRHDLYINLKHK